MVDRMFSGRRHAILPLLLIALACVGTLGACTGLTTPGAGPHARLNAVAMWGASAGWVVGEAGTILRYSGGRWSPVASPTSADLYGVALTAADDGWAVGQDVAQGRGVILHLGHGQWTQMAGVTAPSLRAVAMVSPTEGWAAGGGGTLLHLVGGTWTGVSSPTTADLMALTMRDANDGWATGFGIDNTPTGAVYDSPILRYSGGKWSTVGIARLAQLYGIAAVPQVTWLVGQSAPGGGTILFGSNGLFTPAGGDVDHPIMDVALTSPNDGWAVGFEGVIYHESFNRWEPVTSPTTADLFGLALASSNEGWAVGSDGVILHLRNEAWTRYPA